MKEGKISNFGHSNAGYPEAAMPPNNQSSRRLDLNHIKQQAQEHMRKGKVVSEDYVEGNFLGLPETGEDVDVVVLPLPYELTTSYGQGTAQGPAACIASSGHVELFDAELGVDLPASVHMYTAPEWNGEGGSLAEQLDNISSYLRPWFRGDCFPVVLGGEHGILPPLVHAARQHPLIGGDLSRLTVVQIDAHADLRPELDGEAYSHACAAGRSLDLGVGRLLQVGIRAYSKEEAEIIENDERITTFFARETQSPTHGQASWKAWLSELSSLSGPVHLTVDIDGLDGSLVPATGTPVPGGLSYWQAIETIRAVFNAPNAVIISADINEIVAQEGSPITEFTAAMLATKAIVSHIKARQEGRWVALAEQAGKNRDAEPSGFFVEKIGNAQGD
jgi:agmatinase